MASGGEESIVHGVTPMVYGESWRLQLFGVTGEFLKNQLVNGLANILDKVVLDAIMYNMEKI